jgi:predicted DNA-binding transcriptional regulator AlpA
MTEHESALTPIKAARYLGISEASLRFWRSEGRGPRFYRAGKKLIRYRRVDLDAWIDERLISPAAEPADAHR